MDDYNFLLEVLRLYDYNFFTHEYDFLKIFLTLLTLFVGILGAALLLAPLVDYISDKLIKFLAKYNLIEYNKSNTKYNKSNTNSNDEKVQNAGLEAGFTEPTNTDSDAEKGDYYFYF